VAVAASRLGWFRVDPRSAPPEVGPGLALVSAGPNPSADPSRIVFRTTVEGIVAAAVFDIRGRRIREILGSVLPAGEHRIVWDGSGETGTPSAPGIYFVRILAQGAAPISVKLVRLGGGE
jgi:hypothetical protein